MAKSIHEVLQQNAELFQEVIKEKLTEGMTPAVIIFVGVDNKVETFHREGTDANMLLMLLQCANDWANKLKSGKIPDDYFPEDFKSK